MSNTSAPATRHFCPTPGSLKPQDDWPIRPAFGKRLRMPVLYEIGTLWQCDDCGKWWHACDLPPNPPGGGYRGGGREWRPVKRWNTGMRRRIRENNRT